MFCKITTVNRHLIKIFKKITRGSFRFLKECVLTVQEVVQKECSSGTTWLENKFAETAHHITHATIERTYEYFCHSVFLAEMRNVVENSCKNCIQCLAQREMQRKGNRCIPLVWRGTTENIYSSR